MRVMPASVPIFRPIGPLKDIFMTMPDRRLLLHINWGLVISALLLFVVGIFCFRRAVAAPDAEAA